MVRKRKRGFRTCCMIIRSSKTFGCAVKQQVEIENVIMTHLSFGDGSASSLHYEVGPEQVQKLQQEQEKVEDPPRWVGPNDFPTFKQSGI